LVNSSSCGPDRFFSPNETTVRSFADEPDCHLFSSRTDPKWVIRDSGWPFVPNIDCVAIVDLA